MISLIRKQPLAWTMTFAAAAAASLALSSEHLAAATGPDKALATVDGQPLTTSAYRKSLERLGSRREMVTANPEMRKQFLDHLINSRLLAKSAEAKGVEKSPEFQERMNEVRLELLANFYADQYLAQAMSEKAVKDYFEKNREDFSSKEIRASHILCEAEDKGKEALGEAQKKGANFDELVKKYAAALGCKQSADLGFFKRGRMLPEFEKAAFATKKGEVYPHLVKTQFGFHVVKVTDEKGGGKVDFKEVKAAVESAMKNDLQRELVEDLRKKANVQVDEGALKEFK